MKKILIGAIVIALVLITIINHKSSNKKAVSNLDYMLVSHLDIESARVGDIGNNVNFTGTIKPLNQASLSSNMLATVNMVMVNNASNVQKGQILAVLDDGSSSNDFLSHQAALKNSITTMRFDKLQFESQTKLYQKGFISKFAYYKLRDSYNASKNNVEQQRALLAIAARKLKDSIITAPFQGVIYQKNIESHQNVNVGDVLFKIANLDHMQLVALVSQKDIAMVKPGMNVVFTDDGNTNYHGRITRVSQVATQDTNSYPVYIDIDNKHHQLRSGEFINGSIMLDNLHNATYLPRDYVMHDESTYYVLYLDNNIVKKHTVSPSLVSSSYVAINESDNVIKLGCRVIRGGILNIKPGDKVKIF